MKKLQSLGKILSKEEQRHINGGWACVKCPTDCHCVIQGYCRPDFSGVDC